MKNIILISLLLLIACKQKPQKQKVAQAKPFPVVKALQKEVTNYNSFSANIKGKNTSEIRPKITGYIKKVRGNHINTYLCSQ